MKNIKFRIVMAASAIAVSLGTAEAAYIVDTGPGLSPALGVPSLFASGVAFQHLGASFNVASATRITSVEGWIGGGLGNVLMELHLGASPNGALQFSTPVGIVDITDGWRGANGLDWNVAAGDYTLTVVAQQGFNGHMVTSPANPLGIEWMSTPLAPDWAQTSFDFGWRVDAAVGAVPEPKSFVLVLLGVVALGAAARRQRRG